MFVCVCLTQLSLFIVFIVIFVLSLVFFVGFAGGRGRVRMHTRFSVALHTRLIVRNHCVCGGAANKIDFDFALAYCHVHSYCILVLYFAIHYTIGYAD